MRRFRIVNDLDFDKSMCPDSVFYHEQDDIVEYYREPTVRIWCQEPIRIKYWGQQVFDTPKLSVTSDGGTMFYDRWEDGDMIFNGVHYNCYLNMSDYYNLMNNNYPVIWVLYLNPNQTKAYGGEMTLNSGDSTPVYIMEHTDNTNQIKDLLLRYGYISQEDIDNCATEEDLLNVIFFNEGVDEDGFANWSGDFQLINEYTGEIIESYDSLSGQVFHFDEHFLIDSHPCPTLDRVVLSNGVKNIHYTNIRYPDGFTLPFYVKEIRWSALRESEFSSIKLPEGLMSIPQGMCAENANLTSITIPGSVTCIGDLAFDHCSSLSSVTIPQTVTDIQPNAFYYCTSLTSISFPDIITSLQGGICQGCYNLTDVHLPLNLQQIGSGFFGNCRALSNIDIPNTVTNIGRAAFSSCTSLLNIHLPDNLEFMDERVFLHCSALTSITIPPSLLSLSDNTFSDCTSLSEVILHNGLVYIRRGVFQGCTSLTTITIPSSVSNIDSSAFENCPNLTAIHYNGISSDFPWGATNAVRYYD
ncbi:MAG: leucine-rich repeat domain-containing protein [Prevotella sp.]|nr:leucine-rich repeat domain-containing protein [Prevotella sp.]